MRKWGIIGLALLLLTAGGAEGARRRRPRRTPKPPPVTPSEAIEKRVAAEAARAAELVNRLDRSNLWASPYLVSAIYYHDGLLEGFPDERPDAEPARRILARIDRILTPGFKAAYVDLLRAVYRERFDGRAPERPLAPVAYSARTSRRRRTHAFAVDLFTPEGSPVRAAVGGVVVLAEGNWDAADPFSTSSRRGGNAVIVFDGAADRFYRYCHLDRITVRAGEIVDAGQTIGTVGHTGWNASRRGHGRHLHLEINQYRGGHVRPLTRSQIWELIP